MSLLTARRASTPEDHLYVTETSSSTGSRHKCVSRGPNGTTAARIHRKVSRICRKACRIYKNAESPVNYSKNACNTSSIRARDSAPPRSTPNSARRRQTAGSCQAGSLIGLRAGKMRDQTVQLCVGWKPEAELIPSTELRDYPVRTSRTVYPSCFRATIAM